MKDDILKKKRKQNMLTSYLSHIWKEINTYYALVKTSLEFDRLKVKDRLTCRKWSEKEKVTKLQIKAPKL